LLERTEEAGWVKKGDVSAPISCWLSPTFLPNNDIDQWSPWRGKNPRRIGIFCIFMHPADFPHQIALAMLFSPDQKLHCYLYG
jgi:hypothetical protein